MRSAGRRASEALYDEIGRAQALNDFMQSLRIGSFSANQEAWGYSTVSPLAMEGLDIAERVCALVSQRLLVS